MSLSVGDLKEALRSVLKENEAQVQVRRENYVDHVCSCPDCYCGVLDKARKTFNYQCDECGLPLPDGIVGVGKEHVPCPNCGSLGAEEIERR